MTKDVTLAGSPLARRQESIPRFLDPRAPFLLPLFLLLLTRAWAWRLFPFASEDAYITFRYARNLTRGLGPVFNSGERVMGYTSPVWTVWNAVGIALVKDPVPWSRATTLALEALALVLITRMLLRSFGALSAWTFALFFATWTFFAAMAVSGMENSAFFALLALSAWLVERKSNYSGVALGMLALMRPEGVVTAAIVALGARWKDRLLALGLAGAGLGALAAFYGSPIPQSLVAKAQVYGTPGPWTGRHWWEWIAPFAFRRWPITTEGSVLFAMAVVTGPALIAGIVMLWQTRCEAKALALIAGAGLSVWLGYSVLGVAYFAWYLVLPLATALVLVAIGLPRVTRGPWIPAALSLFVLGSWTIAPELYRLRAGIEYESFAGAARILGQAAKPGESVLLEPIGMVGWGVKVRIIDEIGLVSPWVAERRKQGDGWMTDVIAREHPEFLITRRGILAGSDGGAAFAGRGRPFRGDAERLAVLAQYRLIGTVNDKSGDQAIEVRRSAASAP